MPDCCASDLGSIPGQVCQFLTIFTARVRSMREGNIYTWKCLSVHFGGGVTRSSLGWGGGYLIQPWTGGVPSLRSGGVPSLRSGGYPVSGLGGYPISGWGGTWSQVQGWGGTWSQVWGGLPGLRSGGYPPCKGKNFWHQIWLDTCSDWGKNIFAEGPPPSPQ